MTGKAALTWLHGQKIDHAQRDLGLCTLRVHCWPGEEVLLDLFKASVPFFGTFGQEDKWTVEGVGRPVHDN